jgi:hypothetical protein
MGEAGSLFGKTIGSNGTIVLLSNFQRFINRLKNHMLSGHNILYAFEKLLNGAQLVE